jgi:hypothetical protein
MVAKSEYYTGQLNPTAAQSIDGNPNSPTISGRGTLQQVSVTFEHPSYFGGKNVKRSRFGVEYDGSSTEWCERIHEINESHPPDNSGSTRINITSYNGTNKVYGYYVVLESEFEEQVNVMVENGSSSRTNYHCAVLYNQ